MEDDFQMMDSVMSTKSGLKAMDQKTTCGSLRFFLTDLFNLSQHPSLEENENTQLIPKMLESSKKRRHSKNDNSKPRASVSSDGIKRTNKEQSKSKSMTPMAPEKPRMSASLNKTWMSLRERKKSRLCKDKGKMFQSSLNMTSHLPADDEASDKEPESIAVESDSKYGNTDHRKREKKTREWKRKAGDFSERFTIEKILRLKLANLLIRMYRSRLSTQSSLNHQYSILLFLCIYHSSLK